MKINHIILFFILAASGKSSAQQLIPYVISSSGGFYNNASGMLSFTTGEMSAVVTYTSPSAILTQGFQQSWDFGTSIAEYLTQDFSFGIYPNPSEGHFNLLIDTKLNANVEVKILDILGKEILRTSFHHQSGINVESIDLSSPPQGIYLIALTASENRNSPTYHVTQKIKIVK
jgi:hypothetical protein